MAENRYSPFLDIKNITSILGMVMSAATLVGSIALWYAHTNTQIEYAHKEIERVRVSSEATEKNMKSIKKSLMDIPLRMSLSEGTIKELRLSQETQYNKFAHKLDQILYRQHKTDIKVEVLSSKLDELKNVPKKASRLLGPCMVDGVDELRTDLLFYPPSP